jgi:hypothetical protein
VERRQSKLPATPIARTLVRGPFFRSGRTWKGSHSAPPVPEGPQNECFRPRQRRQIGPILPQDPHFLAADLYERPHSTQTPVLISPAPKGWTTQTCDIHTSASMPNLCLRRSCANSVNAHIYTCSSPSEGVDDDGWSGRFAARRLALSVRMLFLRRRRRHSRQTLSIPLP